MTLRTVSSPCTSVLAQDIHTFCQTQLPPKFNYSTSFESPEGGLLWDCHNSESQNHHNIIFSPKKDLGYPIILILMINNSTCEFAARDIALTA